MGERPVVAVVGGGISGLAAAHRLCQLDAPFVLLEKSGTFGGKIATCRREGFLIEGGPDSFVVGKQAVVELAAALDLSADVIEMGTQGVQVWSRGRLRPVPRGLGRFLRSSLLSVGGKARLGLDLVLARRRAAGDESLESFVSRRLGREVLERIAEPLIAGIHAGEPATMSVAASFPRFVDMEREHRSLLLAARAAKKKKVGSQTHFASLRGGMGVLVDALTKSLAGRDLRPDLGVAQLTRQGDAYRLTLDDGSTMAVDAVILAVPAAVAARLLAPLAPTAASVLGGIRQVATATVSLAYRRGSVPDLVGSGFVVPAVERRQIMGVSYLSNKWEGRVPNRGFYLLRAFVGGVHSQDLATSSEDHLVTVVRAELADMLGFVEAPYLTSVSAWPDGIHQYTLGHLDRVDVAERALAAHPRLALAGSALYGIGLNECIRSGRLAAELVLA